jgi:hypothetical protein
VREYPEMAVVTEQFMPGGDNRFPPPARLAILEKDQFVNTMNYHRAQRHYCHCPVPESMIFYPDIGDV